MTEHSFERDRTKRQGCSVCLDRWPQTEVIAKIFVCTVCSAYAHTQCMPMAATCLPCGEHSPTTPNINHLQGGSVFVKVLQAEDLITTVAGTAVFGTAALVDSQHQAEEPPPVLESAVATVGDGHRCAWTQGAGDVGIDVDNDDSLEIVTLPATDGTGGNTVDADADADIDAWPTLRLELKRRAMLRLFDSAVASCEVSIVPLIAHPNTVAERWFGLTDVATGEACGRLQLQLLFVPAPPAQLTPTNPAPAAPATAATAEPGACRRSPR